MTQRYNTSWGYSYYEFEVSGFRGYTNSDPNGYNNTTPKPTATSTPTVTPTPMPTATPTPTPIPTNTPTPTPTPTQIAGENIALNKNATANQNVSSEEPAKAIDGTVLNNNKWCSDVSGDKWLKFDLGQYYDINGWVVKHAGARGEDVNYNTKNFKLQKAWMVPTRPMSMLLSGIRPI